jgi:manganese oxidase
MKQGERVRWYLYATSDDSDIHTPHWHGQVLMVNHMRTDMVHLEPMMTMIADMVPDNPGIWLFHCHSHGHMDGGMLTRFEVTESKTNAESSKRP